MSKILDIAAFIDMSKGYLTNDVRSPKEFAKGHIPHAVNLPLFSDEERAVVGTLYKEKGKDEAIETGLEIVGPKMAAFVRYVKPLVKDNKIFVHCWRGGLRSGSMAWLFDTMGYEVYMLQDGYKAYRNFVLDELASPRHYIIIGGRTGSGKTEILRSLSDRGEQIIDLERIANHKGSAFGTLGEPPQPTPEQFENDVHLQLSKLDGGRRIWLEDESKNIGKCYIPNGLWSNMCASPIVVVDMPLDVRIERLVRDYGEQDISGLRESILKLEKRLGNEAMKEALNALEVSNFEEVTRITLRYYDKAYDHGIKAKDKKDIPRISFEAFDAGKIVDRLIGLKDKLQANL